MTHVHVVRDHRSEERGASGLEPPKAALPNGRLEDLSAAVMQTRFGRQSSQEPSRAADMSADSALFLSSEFGMRSVQPRDEVGSSKHSEGPPNTFSGFSGLQDEGVASAVPSEPSREQNRARAAGIR